MADRHFNDFVLVGGTALSLKLGHRKSIDIDLFAPHKFKTGSLGLWLKNKYQAEEMRVFKSAVFCYIDQVKVDLVTHAYPEVSPHEVIDGIRIASLPDIAAMKLHAIVQSGARLKDFVDVSVLLEQMPLAKMYAAYEKKYAPHTRAAVARLALNDTSRVNLNDEIQLLGRSFNWRDIKLCLRTAIEFPDKVNLLPKRSYPPLDMPPGKKKGRGR